MTPIKNDPLGNITRTASSEGKEVSTVALRFAMQRAASELIPQERVKICLRYHRPDMDKVHVLRDKNAKKAYFSGLMVCGSVWHCPVCAARISERRRDELSRIANNWTGGLMMVTYTASHKISTPLHEIMETVINGVRSFKSGSKFQKISAKYGWEGSVKGLEVTYGRNGWHPHVHELVFLNSPLNEATLDSLEMALKTHWVDVLGRKGMVASTERGLVVSDDKYELSRYVTKFGHEPRVTREQWANKWTLAHEITKSVVKRASEGGRTPSQLLVDYITGDDEAGEAWREYALAFKGKKQLTWSAGFRKFLKLQPEQTDEEISEETPKETTVYASFSLDQWRQILRHDLRGEILNNAGYMDIEDFSQWMATIIGGWMV